MTGSCIVIDCRHVDCLSPNAAMFGHETCRFARLPASSGVGWTAFSLPGDSWGDPQGHLGGTPARWRARLGMPGERPDGASGLEGYYAVRLPTRVGHGDFRLGRATAATRMTAMVEDLRLRHYGALAGRRAIIGGAPRWEVETSLVGDRRK